MRTNKTLNVKWLHVFEISSLDRLLWQQRNKIMHRALYSWRGTKRLKISRSSLRKSRASKIERRPRRCRDRRGFLGILERITILQARGCYEIGQEDTKETKLAVDVRESTAVTAVPSCSHRNVTCKEHVRRDKRGRTKEQEERETEEKDER